MTCRASRPQSSCIRPNLYMKRYYRTHVELIQQTTYRQRSTNHTANTTSRRLVRLHADQTLTTNKLAHCKSYPSFHKDWRTSTTSTSWELTNKRARMHNETRCSWQLSNSYKRATTTRLSQSSNRSRPPNSRKNKCHTLTTRCPKSRGLLTRFWNSQLLISNRTKSWKKKSCTRSKP